ncbi:esophageal gland cell secretory protein 28, partial [Aphelenchoides avenae]
MQTASSIASLLLSVICVTLLQETVEASIRPLRHRMRRAPRILCINGSEVNGACFCQPGYVGTHCEKKTHCGSYERHVNGTCVTCEKGYSGERCERMECEHGVEHEFEQKCVCDKPYTGTFCDDLTTKDVYYLYNSR